MNWMQAITFGCAMTSTDPVALVALLKDFGFTSKFNTLLEGESLISGAFSMIFYYMLLDVQMAKSRTLSSSQWQVSDLRQVVYVWDCFLVSS
jgi:NhaP-type Na+/H+ or K+/H+ antiporter